MISFSPGPSKVYPELKQYFEMALEQDVMSISHRSPEFVEISKRCLSALKEKLNIPNDYSIVYTSSATECWEIIAQSLTKVTSYHAYTGAFGKKWKDYARLIKPANRGQKFDCNHSIQISELDLPTYTEIMCFTQNETSNGTQVPISLIKEFKDTYSKPLIAVDATSSLGGTALPIELADIWFASVQKCFGLPAGLGIMILSPKAIKKIHNIHEKNYYNSLTFLLEKIQDYQTSCTPNVLNIFFLMNVMENAPNVSTTSENIKRRAKAWYEFFQKKSSVELFISNEEVRSDTVVSVKTTPEIVKSIKEKANQNGFVLGSGYGALKAETFRIANFPAHTDADFENLMDFLDKQLS